MRPTPAILALGLGLAAVMAGAGEPPKPAKSPAAPPSAKPVAKASPAPAGTPVAAGTADGSAIYTQRCARCHGAKGVASPVWQKQGVPDLSDPDWQAMRSDAEVVNIITNGSEDTPMDGYKDTLSAAEIKAVAAFVRTLKAAK